MIKATVDVSGGSAELARKAAEWFAGVIAASKGLVAVALSGGTTPRPLYEQLAAERLPWERIHWFWGDERFVAHDDPASNFRMARDALLTRIPAPAANIHPVPTERITPEAAAAQYEAELRTFHKTRSGPFLFDVALLGIGTDGHTASLFPGDATLNEKSRWVVPVAGQPARISLTLPALNLSRHIAFLATGAEKRAVVEPILAGTSDLPAGRVNGIDSVRYFLDRAASPEQPA